jgi:tetratricopeptide (TPR) repeat protein
MPADIQDAEVAQVIAAARAPVLAEPGSALTWGQYGKVLLSQQFDREASICFEEAVRLDPSDPQWPYALAVIALKRNPDNGPPLLRRTVAAAGERWEEYRFAASLRLAETLLENGDLDEAEHLLRGETERGAMHPRVAMALGLVALARGNTEAAVQHLTAAQSSPFARKFATVQLAVAARRRGDPALADQYEAALAKMPHDPPWPDPLLDAIAPMAVGRRGFERQVKRLEQEGRFDEAAQLYLQRIQMHPSAEDSVAAALNLSRLRRYDEAFPLLREAVRLDPEGAYAHFSLAMVVFARAERDWQTTPNAPQLKDWFREALTHAKRAAELRPGYARAYLFWGLSLKYLGEPAAAVTPLRMGVACEPSDPELQLGLGQALLEAQQPREARTHLENALRLAPAHDPRPAQALERLKKGEKE